MFFSMQIGQKILIENQQQATAYYICRREPNYLEEQKIKML